MSKLAHSCQETMDAIERAANDGRPTEPSTFGHLSTCKVHVYEACTCGASNTRTESDYRAKKGKTFPNDYWIVSSYKFIKHESTEDAYAERSRLQGKLPGKTFEVIHCKRRIEKNEQSREVIARQVAAIAALTAALERTRKILVRGRPAFECAECTKEIDEALAQIGAAQTLSRSGAPATATSISEQNDGVI